MNPIGIIGGSGFYELLNNPRMFIHDNKYGRSSEIFAGDIDGIPVYFLPRHGPHHKIIVPRINYRANIWAMRELGVTRILATNSVGSMNPDIPPGDFVVPHDFIDHTSRRPRSLYDDMIVAYHVDMTPPYCPELRECLITSAREVEPGSTHDQAVLIVNEGLRFETPAELRVFRSWGADLVGMTTVPEVVFAREAGICYAHICVPVNYAMGERIEASEFQRILSHAADAFKEILRRSIHRIPAERNCPCKDALNYAVLDK